LTLATQQAFKLVAKRHKRRRRLSKPPSGTSLKITGTAPPTAKAAKEAITQVEAEVVLVEPAVTTATATAVATTTIGR
jgi:hypothetical protein